MPLGQQYRTYGGQGAVWFGGAPTVGGVATFYPTDDGTATGQPLFAIIGVVFHGAKFDTTLPTVMPLTSHKATSADRTTVTINCLVGTSLLALGPTLLPAPDGTLVYCQIWGN